MTPDEAKERLRARRDELTASMATIEDQLDEPVPKDWDDAATETENDEVLQSLGETEQAEVRRIDAALSRIEDGTWGTCVNCGEPIQDKRLALLPETPALRPLRRRLTTAAESPVRFICDNKVKILFFGSADFC